MAESYDGKGGEISVILNNLFESQFAGRYIENIIDPELIFDRIGLTTFIPTSERAIMMPIKRGDTYGTESSSGRSAKKVRPPIHEEGTAYPSIDVEGYWVAEETTQQYGYKASFGEDVQTPKPINVRRIRDTYNDIGRWLLEEINYTIMDGAFNSFSATSGSELASYMDNSSDLGYDSTYGFIYGNIAADSYWNDLTKVDFVTDIVQLKTAFSKQSGYRAGLDTLMLDTTIIEKMKLWLYENGRSWEWDPMGGGLGREAIKFENVTCIQTSNVDGLSGNEDKVIMMDSRYVPCTTYFYTGLDKYPGFSRWSEKAMVATKSYIKDEETNQREVAFRLEHRTVIDYPNYYGFIEVY